MWRDDPQGAAVEFAARVERGDTEFPVDLLKAVVAYDQGLSDDLANLRKGARKADSQDDLFAMWVSGATVDEVKRFVGDDADRAKAALRVETKGDKRTSLVSWLDKRAQ